MASGEVSCREIRAILSSGLFNAVHSQNLELIVGEPQAAEIVNPATSPRNRQEFAWRLEVEILLSQQMRKAVTPFTCDLLSSINSNAAKAPDHQQHAMHLDTPAGAGI